MKRKIDPELILEVAASLQDWIPMSETRALRWASDLLDQRASSDEPITTTARRINDAARRTAQASRDVRYHDVYATVCWLIKREIEDANQARQDLDRRALPTITGGLRTGNIAVGIFTDIATRLISADSYDEEFRKRREMTDEQLEQHRRELMEKRGHA